MLAIYVINDRTGTDEVAHYDYAVSINGVAITKGRIEYHTRDDGWQELAYRIINNEQWESEQKI